MDKYEISLIAADSLPNTGIRASILEFLGGHVGNGTYAVATLPKAKTDEELEYALRLAHNPGVQYFYVDDDKYVFVRIGGLRGWLTFAERASISVLDMEKTVKRLKMLNRPSLLGTRVSHLRVEVVSPTAYTRENLADELPGINAALPEELQYSLDDAEEMLTDGFLVISPRLRDKLIEQSRFHDDPVRRDLQIHRAKNADAFNIRWVDENGEGKGNCVVGKNMPRNVDIITSSANVKKELLSHEHIFVLLEPQDMGEHVVMNTQSQITIRPVFDEVSQEEWLEDHFAWARILIELGMLLHTFKDVEASRWKRLKELDAVNEGITTAMKYSLIEYVMRGGDITKSPKLTEWASDVAWQNLTDDKGNVRIPVPCAVHAQTISESMATMAGVFVKVERGQKRFVRELNMVVVNDIDYIVNYVNHGGNDGDDLYDHFFRTLDGRKVIISLRSPNGKGEYSIGEYVEGDWYPKWHKADNTTVSFPEVSSEGWTATISEALASGDLRYTGLPKAEVITTDDGTPVQYSRETAISHMLGTYNTGSVGNYINARILWDDTFPWIRPEHLCSMEDSIDTFVNPAAHMAREVINKGAEQLVKEVIDSGLGIDAHLWESRNYAAGLPKGTRVNLVEGHFTRSKKLVDRYTNEFKVWRAQFMKANMEIPDPMVHVLGGGLAALQLQTKEITRGDLRKDFVNDHRYSLYQRAADLTRRWRREVAQHNRFLRDQEEQILQDSGREVKLELSSDTWVQLYTPIMEEFDKVERKYGLMGRHTFALALLSCSYILEKTDGSKSDSIPWNAMTADNGTPQGPFRYVMDAMMHFGMLAEEVSIDDDGHLDRHFADSWTLTCVVCGTVHVTNSADTYQRVVIAGSTCKDCKKK